MARAERAGQAALREAASNSGETRDAGQRGAMRTRRCMKRICYHSSRRHTARRVFLTRALKSRGEFYKCRDAMYRRPPFRGHEQSVSRRAMIAIRRFAAAKVAPQRARCFCAFRFLPLLLLAVLPRKKNIAISILYGASVAVAATRIFQGTAGYSRAEAARPMS